MHCQKSKGGGARAPVSHSWRRQWCWPLRPISSDLTFESSQGDVSWTVVRWQPTQPSLWISRRLISSVEAVSSTVVSAVGITRSHTGPPLACWIATQNSSVFSSLVLVWLPHASAETHMTSDAKLAWWLPNVFRRSYYIWHDQRRREGTIEKQYTESIYRISYSPNQEHISLITIMFCFYIFNEFAFTVQVKHE